MNFPINFSEILASLIFGSIGFVAFIYGKKNQCWAPMIIGGLLMGYTYLVTGIIWTYVIGILLTVALFVLKDY